MGLFGLFRKDAGEELEKASGWLEKGDAVRALETARRHVGDRDARHRTRALELVDQAREALVRSGVEKSASAEARGDHADAADWMRAALQHVDDERRAEMEARLGALERRAEIGRREPEPWEAAARRESAGRDDEARHADVDDLEPDLSKDDWAEEEDGADFDDPETRYELLVDTLDDAVLERWAGRDAQFRQAFLALHEGDAEGAAAGFDRLLAARPGDAVLHFERGRARMLLGDETGARQDLEAAWPEIGDAPLDRAGSLRVPTLWAEAALADGDAEAVVERLGGLADPAAGDADLTALYGAALVRAAPAEEARDFLAAAMNYFPKRPDVALALAGVLHRLGDAASAISVLERSIAPSCKGGSCAVPAPYLPSLRALVALHLGARPAPAPRPAGKEEEELPPVPWAAADTVSASSLDRVEDLMRWIAGTQGGRLAAGDHLLAARYHEVCGDAERATEARDRARRAAAEAPAADDATSTAPADLAAATGKAAL
jgi:tetratricopeptide (TPR) repeat protein